MFEVGFSELLLILLVALLVLGPERLPQLARTWGRWLGRARALFNSVRSEINQELAAEELKRVLAEQQKHVDVYELLDETPPKPTAVTPAHEENKHG
jgi:sec-independent protein translocase protein TatB